MANIVSVILLVVETVSFHRPARESAVSNPLLLLFWYRLFATEPTRRPPRWRVPMSTSRKASATIFLVMRRMRAPLIVLIVIFAISTLGLTLIPGQDAQGRPWRMGFFDAFYVMSYTASTIGFGEIPYPFTTPVMIG